MSEKDVSRIIDGHRIFNINYQSLEQYIFESSKFIEYQDISREWLDQATPNSHEIIEQQFIEVDGIKYEVDGKNVVFDAGKKEKEVSKWLKEKFGGEIILLPRVNYPNGIQTADFLFRKEKWDLKTITGNSDKVFYKNIKNKEKQSHNFIFDITLSSINSLEIKKQINAMYKRDNLSWLGKIIVKKDDDIFGVYKRKEKSWRPRALHSRVPTL